MERHEKSRVVKVDSEETWELLISRAKNQGCLVVAHFTAAWCRPSVAMKHYFEVLSLNFKNIRFLSLDVDEVREVASKMEIKAMPTFLLMREGAQVDKIVGANRDEIRKRIAGFV